MINNGMKYGQLLGGTVDGHGGSKDLISSIKQIEREKKCLNLLKDKHICFGYLYQFFLLACEYSYYVYSGYLRKTTEVVKIELIRYNNPIVKDNPLGKYSLDLEKLEKLEVLSDDKLDNFMDKLFDIYGLGGKPRKVLNSHNGIGIRITRSDNSFTLITVMELAIVNKNGSDAVFTGDYDADSNVVNVFEFSWQRLSDDFKTLINEYFTTQI